ncbi:RusA family crossover junction endodeoxyribonuclease [Streptomyces niveus]|uniref:RusA family crossover junction endodeoxyribonuclease n=1 Tax=Streptomyces niveus TaxID=193462 RepID=UPI00342666A4
MSTRIDAQRLITEHGYRPCPSCSALLRPTTAICSYCRTPIPPTVGVTVPGRSKQPRLAAPNEKAIGGLGHLSEQRLAFTVIGTPVTQGSVDVPAPGVVKYSRELRDWRTRVNNTAREACGESWEPANCPLVMSAVFTLPRPPTAPKTKIIYPAVKPDIDKLIRAVQDALAPRGKNAFHVYTEDSRIVGYATGPFKTYPAPLHTHHWALTEPGVSIALVPAPPAASAQDIP